MLDLGLRKPVRGCTMFAALKGVIDAGVKMPHDDGMLPSEDRINGKHMKDGTGGMFVDVRGKIGGAE